MKKLNTETEKHGVTWADVNDYQSGTLLGTAKADWDAYRLWAGGPSDVCEAGRCLPGEALAALGIGSDRSIFLL